MTRGKRLLFIQSAITITKDKFIFQSPCQMLLHFIDSSLLVAKGVAATKKNLLLFWSVVDFDEIFVAIFVEESWVGLIIYDA